MRKFIKSPCWKLLLFIKLAGILSLQFILCSASIFICIYFLVNSIKNEKTLSRQYVTIRNLYVFTNIIKNRVSVIVLTLAVTIIVDCFVVNKYNHREHLISIFCFQFGCKYKLLFCSEAFLLFFFFQIVVFQEE